MLNVEPLTTSSASFVLTFCGVDFCLDPKQIGATIALEHDNSTTHQIQLTLTNFTGQLKVSSNNRTPSLQTNVHTTPPSVPSNVGRVSLSPESLEKQPLLETKTGNKRKTTAKVSNPRQQNLKNEGMSKAARSVDRSDEETRTMYSKHKRQVLIESDDSPSTSSKKVKDSVDGSPQKTNQDEDMLSSKTSREECSTMVCTSTNNSSSQSHPAPRWGHTLTLIDDNTKALMYGGQTLNETTVSGEETLSEIITHDDLHLYDFLTKQFSKPIHCEGVQRQWHSATYLPEKQLLVVFGGEAPVRNNNKNKRMETLNQVMVLDTEIMLWYPPTVSGDVPTGRSGHSASLLLSDSSHLNSIVIWGGVGKGNKYQRTVSVLDTHRWKWTTPPKVLGDAPRPRSYHTATTIPRSQSAKDGRNTPQKDWIVIFGGNDHASCFNSVHVLEVHGNCWSWINPIVSGDIPAPRTGHVAELMEDGKTIFVHGGWDPIAEGDEDQEVIFDDCFLLDTSTWLWNKLDQKAPARVGHRSVSCNNDIYMFGGRLEGGKFTNDVHIHHFE